MKTIKILKIIWDASSQPNHNIPYTKKCVYADSKINSSFGSDGSIPFIIVPRHVFLNFYANCHRMLPQQQLDALKGFVSVLQMKPDLLHTPELSFFKVTYRVTRQVDY